MQEIAGNGEKIEVERQNLEFGWAAPELHEWQARGLLRAPACLISTEGVFQPGSEADFEESLTLTRRRLAVLASAGATASIGIHEPKIAGTGGQVGVWTTGLHASAHGKPLHTLLSRTVFSDKWRPLLRNCFPGPIGSS